MGLTASFADDHLEGGRSAFRGASDVDHVGLQSGKLNKASLAIA
jgi:hypothetical protein